MEAALTLWGTPSSETLFLMVINWIMISFTNQKRNENQWTLEWSQLDDEFANDLAVSQPSTDAGKN